MTAIVYTDASHDSDRKIAACGHCILYGNRNKLIKHQVLLYENIHTPTNAECIAIVNGIQDAFMLKGVKVIVVNTDCKGISVALRSAKKGHKQLKKYDAFNELKETIIVCEENGIEVFVNHIKGHNGHKYNTMIDTSCRTNLRKHLKTI